MSSAVGHTLCGLAISELFFKRKHPGVKGLSIMALIANLPDFDFLLVYLPFLTNQKHHGWTHSVGFATLCALPAFWLNRGKTTANHTDDIIGQYGYLVFCVILSHLILDYFTVGKGMPLFWPLSEMQVISPFMFLPGIAYGSLELLLSAHNLKTVGIELLIWLPVLGVIRHHAGLKRL